MTDEEEKIRQLQERFEAAIKRIEKSVNDREKKLADYSNGSKQVIKELDSHLAELGEILKTGEK